MIVPTWRGPMHDERREVAVGHDPPPRHLLHGPQDPLHDDVVHGGVCPTRCAGSACWSRPHHGPTPRAEGSAGGRERPEVAVVKRVVAVVVLSCSGC